MHLYHKKSWMPIIYGFINYADLSGKEQQAVPALPGFFIFFFYVKSKNLDLRIPIAPPPPPPPPIFTCPLLWAILLLVSPTFSTVR